MGNNKNNILICGLGAIGGYYAVRFQDKGYNLKVLVDKDRIKRYKETPRIINGEVRKFDYILPDETGFNTDIIIIATKSNGLKDVIKNIKNFVTDNTIILSFMNGITSEKEIIGVYGNKVLYSYLLGHTFFRNGNEITHDGHAKIIYGSTKENDDRVEYLRQTFENIGVGYEISDNILKAQWQKFCFNCCVNQLSALNKMTFGELSNSKKSMEIMRHICSEVEEVAKCEGIPEPDFYHNLADSLALMIPEGKTSMLQDIESGRKPETDIFGKTVVLLGVKHNVPTPYNKVISDILDSLEP
ncbi:MAG: ketopantoate reductase family protein [Cyanobacteria bacterium RUI128]|nr:ketopantoate reductase family protein [Cyanobacteria bacterium RUI128]